MLRDSDYRVRLFLARRIGVLFQTWEGHEELFEDIWSVLLCYVIFYLEFLDKIYGWISRCMLLDSGF